MDKQEEYAMRQVLIAQAVLKIVRDIQKNHYDAIETVLAWHSSENLEAFIAYDNPNED
jgi:hypothetical protein